MYKATYAAGEKWFEWIKMRPSVYATYRVNGNGSTTQFDQYTTMSLARKWVQFMNDNYATEGGRKKIADMSNGADYMTKETWAKYRLAYLKTEIEAERISQSEIAELQSLVKYIHPSDTLLLEWAGVEEGTR